MDTFTQKKDFLEKHIKLQKELIFDDVSKTLDGKAMFAFSKIDNSKVLFLHTGGTPLFVDDILSNSLL